MKTLLRSLLMALLGASVIVALIHIDTLRAQGQTAAPPPAATPPAASAPPEDADLAPGDRVSADNNVTFPTDI